ncbi:COR domain-containing protein, partial [Chloroflexota bacterium]
KVANKSQPDDGISKIQLNVWDFGGQEIMHATHRFFLTQRSLYILVLNARQTQEENRVEYWIKMIQSFGGDSPVLIVGNKIDQHPLDIDQSGLQKKYPHIVSIIETSAATGSGIKQLKNEIIGKINLLPHVRDLLPETWFTVKTQLETLGQKKNFITQDQYLEICIENEVSDEPSQRTLLGFLHDLGVILYFQDDPRLETLGILNPQWVTNGVYKILNSHSLFHNKGTLTRELLNEILNLPEYPTSKRLFIVDMMRKFELCYDIESDKKFLVPDLLPKDEPFTGEWDDALAFQYHYNVLPSSIITRFIVRMNAFVHQPTTWRSGTVLKKDGNTALVKADYEDKVISVLVQGSHTTRRDFLAMIRGTFEAIHHSIARIEAVAKVPHPDHPELILDHAELIEFERQGIKEFPRKVGSHIVTVNVKRLLAGVEGDEVPKVFISYDHTDDEFVQNLAKDLIQANIPIWQDRLTLEGGDIWADEIGRGIEQCKIFLVVLSPEAVASDWVKKEYTYALNNRCKVVPILCQECNLPFALTNIQYVDFSRKTYNAAFAELNQIIEKQVD